VQWVESEGIKPEKKVELPRGLYLPLWTFDIGGTLDYTGEIVEQEYNPFTKKRERKVVRISDKYPVLVDDLPLPASRKLSAVFSKLIPTFELSRCSRMTRAFSPRGPRRSTTSRWEMPRSTPAARRTRQLKRDLSVRLGSMSTF
jgi:hypothetical protein